MPFRRHGVIGYGWDETKKLGWMRFKCLTCGHEYKMWMYHKKLWEYKPPEKPGAKTTRRKKRYSESEIKFYGKYWRLDGGGVSVSECVCIPKKVKYENHKTRRID
jgi:hypothetical protein